MREIEGDPFRAFFERLANTAVVAEGVPDVEGLMARGQRDKRAVAMKLEGERAAKRIYLRNSSGSVLHMVPVSDVDRVEGCSAGDIPKPDSSVS